MIKTMFVGHNMDVLNRLEKEVVSDKIYSVGISDAGADALDKIEETEPDVLVFYCEGKEQSLGVLSDRVSFVRPQTFILISAFDVSCYRGDVAFLDTPEYQPDFCIMCMIFFSFTFFTYVL